MSLIHLLHCEVSGVRQRLMLGHHRNADTEMTLVQ